MTATRMCISCRKRNKKEELIRIIAKEKEAFLDNTQKENTRGIYICNKKECINKLLMAKDISKCVKINVDIDSLRELLKNLGE